MKKSLLATSLVLIALATSCQVPTEIESDSRAGARAAASPVGIVVTLKAQANAKYVAYDAASKALDALSASPVETSSFEIVDLGNSTVALKASNGQFVSADTGLGPWAPLVADRPTAGTWEQFRLVDLGSRRVQFRSVHTNLFVCADLNRSARLVADRSAAQGWETFEWAPVALPSPSLAPSVSPTTIASPSPSTAPTPSPISGVRLEVQLTKSSTWPTGYTAKLVVKNVGTAGSKAWQVQWTYPAGTKVSNGWNGVFSTNGNAVKITSLDYNRTIAAGGSIEMGFNADGTADPIDLRAWDSDAPEPSPTPTATPGPSPSPLPSPSSTPTPVPSPTPIDRVEQLIAQMTLDEKIGQMMQPNWGSIKNDADVAKYGFGSILNGGGESSGDAGAASWADLYEKYQRLALQSRLKIPMIWGTDAVHGNNNVRGATIFPHNIGLGATRNAALVERASRATAVEMVATGINWAFGPCVAVPRDERWGRTYEGYGEDPNLVSTLGAASIRGFQQANLFDLASVLACAKHFLGDGGTLGGQNEGNLVCDEATLRQIYLKPYIAAIEAQVDSIMVSYSSWNGVKMHEHKYLLTDVLKGELGFRGFLVSDWAAIKQLPGSVADQIRKSINAGLDMIMLPDYYPTFLTTTRDLVAQGQIPLTRIDDAVRRILTVKEKLGLFDHNEAVRSLLPQVGSAEHRAIARQAVRESMVVLKNEGLLPLSKANKRIVVAGSKANDIGIQCGGWSISWQGSSGPITTGTTIVEGVRKTVAGTSTVDFSADGTAVTGHDFAIVVVGEQPYAESAGDNATLALSDVDKRLLSSVEASGVPYVVVLLSGRPLIVTSEIAQANAWVAAWLPGTEGQGVADVLFGDSSPTGKLPCTWPRDLAQIPINVGDGKTGALFEYGFGLTY